MSVYGHHNCNVKVRAQKKILHILNIKILVISFKYDRKNFKTDPAKKAKKKAKKKSQVKSQKNIKKTNFAKKCQEYRGKI